MEKYMFWYTDDDGRSFHLLEIEGKTFTDAVVNAYAKLPKNAAILEYKYIKEKR